jgi:hypothetical protein
MQSLTSCKWRSYFGCLAFVITCMLSNTSVAQFPINQTGNQSFHTLLKPDATNTTYNGRMYLLSPPAAGYHRVRVEFLSAVPTTADVTFNFSFTFNSYNAKNPTASVNVVIPQGATSGFADVFVPKSGNSYLLMFETYVDDRFSPDLSNRGGVYLSDTESYRMIVGVLNDKQKDALRKKPEVVLSMPNKPIHWTFPISIGAKYGNSIASLDEAMRVANADSLPTDPFDWSSIARVIIDADVLVGLPSETKDCLKWYVRAGGHLVCVSGELDEAAIRNRFSEFWGDGQKFDDSAMMVNRVGQYTSLDQQLGFGFVTLIPKLYIDEAITSEELMTYQLGAQLGNAGLTNRAFRLSGQDFWTWSLERLGQPPVTAFAALIGLFAGVFAPASLIYCLRTHRSAWLLIIFPIFALAATASLFAFAIFNDGFGSYSRVRSYTILDTDRDVGFCMSRQVLFCGTRPTDGLRFNVDSEVWPINYSTDDYRRSNNSAAGAIKWTDDEQIYDVKTSREQIQYSVSQPIRNLKPFTWVQRPTFDKVDSKRVASESCSIMNSSTEKIDFMFVADGFGHFYIGRDIEPNATATLMINEVDALKQLQDFELTQPMEPPEAMDGSTTSFYLGQVWNSKGAQANFLQQVIQENMDPRFLQSNACFIVYPAEGKHVDRALDEAQEDESLHTIFGRWSVQP